MEELKRLLLQADDEYLAGLSNKGTVKRAYKDLEQEKLYKVPLFTVGNYVFTSSNVKIPEGATFCNPLYSCDLDFANWEMA